MPATLYMASLDTRNFTFEAFGRSKRDALKALRAGLKKHGEDRGLPYHWNAQFCGDYKIRRVAIGKAYRDGEEITP